MVTATAPQFVAQLLDLLPLDPPSAKRGSPYGSDDRCWLCGGPTSGVGWPIAKAFGKTFTDTRLAVVPTSETACQGCVATSSGQTWAAYAARRPELGLKTTPPLSWRSYSHAVAETLPGHHLCPKKPGWRALLLNPPEPPFVFAITEAGKKHLIYRSQIAYDRDVFPVQYEDDRIIVDRAEFAQCLMAFETLYQLGCTKDEIATGRYNQGRLLKIGLDVWHSAERRFAPWRTSAPELVRLAALCAQRTGESIFPTDPDRVAPATSTRRTAYQQGALL